MIAALYVNSGGFYFGRDGIEPWDEARDARKYEGEDPVIAHPPCSRWCRLAGLVEARWSRVARRVKMPGKRGKMLLPPGCLCVIGMPSICMLRGHDDGCFAHAVTTVRRVGGVLEHPAYSDAWKAFGIARPPRSGGWVKADEFGGWTCHVEQGRYGHVAKKATWLYAVRCELPSLRWGSDPDVKSKALVSWCGNHVSSGEKRPRVGKRAAAATPPEFGEMLIAMANSVRSFAKGTGQ